MERRSLNLDMDSVVACLELLQTCPHIPAPGQSLLVYTEDTHGDTEHPALTPLSKPGAPGGIFPARPALFEVADQSDLADAVLSVGAYGFASVLEVPSHVTAEVLRRARGSRRRVGLSPRG